MKRLTLKKELAIMMAGIVYIVLHGILIVACAQSQADAPKAVATCYSVLGTDYGHVECRQVGGSLSDRYPVVLRDCRWWHGISSKSFPISDVENAANVIKIRCTEENQ